MLRAAGGRGNREMNWLQFSTSIPEAFVLAPSPVSFKGFDPNKTSNQKLSLFQFSKIHTRQRGEKKSKICFLISCFLSQSH